MSWIQNTGSRELYISGLKLMRSGVLIIIISTIIGTIAIGLMFLSLLGVLIPLFTPGRIKHITEVVIIPVEGGITIRNTTTIIKTLETSTQVEESLRKIFEKLLLEYPHVVIWGIIAGILLLISLVLGLIGYWARFIPGARRLGRARVEFSTASTLVWIGYFWGYLVFLIMTLIGLGILVYAIFTQSIFGIFVTSMGILTGFIIAAILVLIGYIGLIILVFKLYEFEKNTLYFITAILLVVDLILRFTSFIPYIGLFTVIGTSILSFIAWILLYIALGESIKRAESQLTPPTPPTQQMPPPL